MSEILAPAGGENSAFAAINSGADAIYLGLSNFSARSSAENFDAASFEKISKYARAFGVKVYVTLNTVVKDSELLNFLNCAVSVWNAGADALILQDLYLGKYLKEKCPEIQIHLSTQAGTCNAAGARLAKQYGFDRVILARETSLEDIAEISKIIETEAFVQGALCTCFSGQCYMSSFAGGNSGNRGKCKQPCRKLYSIDRDGFGQQAYRLSLSDLSVGENIKDLIEAGVSSFKIEGRMRRPEYVAAAVSYYRDLIKDCAPEISALKRSYNRGNYTKGLAFGQDKSFISSAVQGHIGEFVGIIKVINSAFVCLSTQKFSNGDGFKILREGKEIGGGAFGGEAKGGFIINTRTRLKNGDKVFVTTDTAITKKLLSKRRLINVKVKIGLNAGKRAVAVINGLTVYGDVLESANTRPLTLEEIKKNFNKVDGLPFSPECEVETDGVFMAASALNAFRRKVYTDFFESISENKNKFITAHFNIPQIRRSENTKTAVICTSLKGLNADIGILKPNDYSINFTQLTDGFSGEKYLYIPPYLSGREIKSISANVSDFDGIYCDGYFGQQLAQELNTRFIAGTGFNITNSLSLSTCNARYVCLSKELTMTEAEAMSKDNTFYLTDGNIKVMDLIYCPFEKKCKTCDKRNEYTLTDGEGRKFPLRRYRTSDCRFEVYNCAQLVTDKRSCGKLIDKTIKAKNNNVTRGHSVSAIL